MNLKNITGLSDEEVISSKNKYGTNVIDGSNKNSFFSLLLESFQDPIIKILLIVLAVKTVFLFKNFDWFETLGIVIAILLASIISTLSEYGSEKSFQKLQKESSKIKCKVIRNKLLTEIFIEEIVVGDIVNLTSGDIIPADGVIIDSEISVDESSFTGETKEIKKTIGSTVYRGSTVLNGNCLVRIENIGSKTKYGEISKELLNKNPESPLKSKLKDLAQTISKMGYTGAILVVISYLFSVIFIENKFDFEIIRACLSNPQVLFGHIIYALTLGVTIIIVSVPEGLPMMVALVLSSNMKKMVKDNVLVRRLVGIETAGNINNLLVDKTGTITKGNMEVVGIILGNGKLIKTRRELDLYPKIKNSILENMSLNNDSVYDINQSIIGGNTTDKALLKFCHNYKSSAKVLDKKYFNSDDKYSSIKIDNGIIKYYLKGAPEKLIPLTYNFYDIDGKIKKLDEDNIKNLLKKYTGLGYRVIFLGEKISKNSKYLTFLGLVLLKDEVRENAKETIKSITNAKVNVMMITGDAKDTAVNIGREIGLLRNDDDIVLTSRELNLMSDSFIEKKYDNIKIIARALPTDKSRLVKIGQKLGKVVGMTGDGINDAPALKQADVGFAMGNGSEVSKEASDIVILDNNLSSIEKAILYGRTIFKSIRKFIIFQLTMNICALLLSIVGPFIGVNTPVTVMQMLWLNMIMDTLAGLAFSFEPALKEYMNYPPTKRSDKIINNYMYNSILITGLYTSIILILFLKLPIFKFLFTEDHLMTGFFGLFVFSSIFNALNARTTRLKLWANLHKNKPFIFIFLFIFVVQIILLYKGGNTFRTHGLTLNEFSIIICISLSVLPVDLFRKLYLKSKNKDIGI